MQRVDQERIGHLALRAASSPRLRANDNLHPELGDPIQRFLNAVEPGSYVRPHRHSPGRWEFFLALAGGAALLTFNEEGCVLERVELSGGGPVRGLEVPPGIWHTLVALEGGTVLFELKPGPYAPTADKDFAPWAPAEGEPACPAFAAWFAAAERGDGPDDAHCPR
jgi:cupin fold WbuC family metalloprotein